MQTNFANSTDKCVQSIHNRNTNTHTQYTLTYTHFVMFMKISNKIILAVINEKSITNERSDKL